MTPRIVLSPSQTIRLEKAVDRLERTGPVERPLFVASIARRGAARFFVLRQRRTMALLESAGSHPERSALISTLSAESLLVWFHLSREPFSRGEEGVKLFTVLEERGRKALLESSSGASSPSRTPRPRRPRRRSRSA